MQNRVSAQIICFCAFLIQCNSISDLACCATSHNCEERHNILKGILSFCVSCVQMDWMKTYAFITISDTLNQILPLICHPVILQ